MGEAAGITVDGPWTTSVPDSSIVSLFFYDVVTQTNSAGDPTRRENYEWHYLITHEVRDTIMPIKVKYEVGWDAQVHG